MTSTYQHLWLRDLERHPAGEVRLLVDGKLVSGTLATQVTGSIDAMLAEARALALTERGLDPTPELVGPEYSHAHSRREQSRVCRRLANGKGWYPLRWGPGDPNTSGGSICLLPHPEQEGQL